MNIREIWKLGLRNVRAAPLRSLLTVVGMAIGVGAILAVLTLGEAGQKQVQDEMKRLGIDKVWITAASQEAGLQKGDGQLLEESLRLPAVEQIYLPTVVSSGREQLETTVIGCAEEYLSINGIHCIEGRMLYPLEWDDESRCALVGEKAAEELHLGAGDRVFIGGRAFRVCGIVRSENALAQIDAEQSVLVPAEILCMMTEGRVHEILLDVPASMEPQKAAEMAQKTLLSRRNISVDTLTMQVQMEAANSILATFINVLKWVALICMLVGGIGVMNILLVSVRERKREIGVMKSLGTTRMQVCMLFMLEALIYGVNGGFWGILTGGMIVHVAGKSIGLPAAIHPIDCAVVLLAAVGIGLLFGVTPAARAADLKPVEALRME